MLSVDVAFAATAAGELNELIDRDLIDPIVGSVHPLAGGAEALWEIDRRESVGKSVLRVRE